jgi:hypothetical protein
MSKNIDDIFDDTETMKSVRFWTFWLNCDKPSTPKYIDITESLQNPFKIWNDIFLKLDWGQ